MPKSGLINRRAAIMGGAALTLSGRAFAQRYSRLATIRISHGFFGEEPAGIDCRLIPSRDTQGLFLRTTPEGAMIYTAEDVRPETLRVYFEFSDPVMIGITPIDGELPNRAGGLDDFILAKAGPEDGPATLSLTSASDVPFGIRQRYQGMIDLTFPPSGEMDVTLNFRVLKTYWRYIILPNNPEDDFQIVDPSGDVTFRKGDSFPPLNDKIPVVLQSDEPLMLKNSIRPDDYFELRTIDGLTLVRKLPIASPDIVTWQDNDEGEHIPYSDIYIHL